MQAGPSEELEKLLAEVRRTIAGNRQFLEALADDTADPGADTDGAAEDGEEEFEEL